MKFPQNFSCLLISIFAYYYVSLMGPFLKYVIKKLVNQTTPTF